MDQPRGRPGACIRLIEVLPACEEPLSTIQNTVLADAYGSLVMTCSTSRPNGTIPVFCSKRSNRLAWCTSHAAR